MATISSIEECCECKLNPESCLRYVYVDETCLGVVCVTVPKNKAESKHKIWWGYIKIPRRYRTVLNIPVSGY